MPKKTNEFQELIALMQRSLAPRGAKVTESALVSANQREIDVLIESESGGFSMKVAIEAKDEARKMDIVRFESIIGKYSKTSGVGIDKVIVINRAGFSKKVHARASVEGIVLLTLDEALVADWASTANQTLLFQVPPHVSHIEFDPPVARAEASAIATAARIVCTCCGKDHGTAMSWAQRIIMDPDFASDLMVSASRANQSVCCRANWSIPAKFRFRTESGDKLFSSMTAHLHCTAARGKLAVKAYQHGESVVHHFSTSVAGGVVQFVVPNGPHSEQIAFKLSKPEATSLTLPISSPQLNGGANEITVSPPPQLTPLAARVVRLLENVLSSLDVRIATNATIHEFASGEDIQVDIAVYIYAAGMLRLCTVIVLSDGNADATVRRVLKCGVDRVVVLQTDTAPKWEDGDGSLIKVGQQTFEAGPVDCVVPRTLLWVRKMPNLTASLWGNVKPALGTTWENAKITRNQATIDINQFAHELASQLDKAAIRAFVSADAPRSAYGERELRFEFQLPRSSRIISGNKDYSVSSVKGVARVNGLATVLDQAIVDRTKTPTIRLSSSTGSFATDVATLPRGSKTIELRGPQNPTLPPYLGQYSVPVRFFDNFWASPGDNGKAPSNLSPYQVATLNLKQETWQMQLLPLRHQRPESD